MTKTNVMAAVFRRVQSYVSGTVHPRLYHIWRAQKSLATSHDYAGSLNASEVAVPCPRFGKRKGVMSPLQRVTDICVLGWPLAVCVAIDPAEITRYRSMLNASTAASPSSSKQASEQDRAPMTIMVH